jgi:hypothetical protein
VQFKTPAVIPVFPHQTSSKYDINQINTGSKHHIKLWGVKSRNFMGQDAVKRANLNDATRVLRRDTVGLEPTTAGLQNLNQKTLTSWIIKHLQKAPKTSWRPAWRF